MLHHVEIYVDDIQAEFNFWKNLINILNLKIINKWSTCFSIGSKSCYISFNQSSTSDYTFKRTNQGINHICFSTYESMSSILTRLKQQGFKIVYEDKQIFDDSVFLKTPEV